MGKYEVELRRRNLIIQDLVFPKTSTYHDDFFELMGMISILCPINIIQLASKNKKIVTLNNLKDMYKEYYFMITSREMVWKLKNKYYRYIFKYDRPNFQLNLKNWIEFIVKNDNEYVICEEIMEAK